MIPIFQRHWNIGIRIDPNRYLKFAYAKHTLVHTRDDI